MTVKTSYKEEKNKSNIGVSKTDTEEARNFKRGRKRRRLQVITTRNFHVNNNPLPPFQFSVN